MWTWKCVWFQGKLIERVLIKKINWKGVTIVSSITSVIQIWHIAAYECEEGRWVL